LEEYTTTVKDAEIERQIQANANDVCLKQSAIKNLEMLIREYQLEQEQIQNAAALFGLFLKKHSITPYNDATLAYLDILIQDEQAKIDAALSSNIPVEANKKRLSALTEDKRRHIELVDVLTQSMKSNANFKVLDEAGVDHVVRGLYNLKHFGKNLQSVKHTIASAHRATYRERPYRIQRVYNYVQSQDRGPAWHPAGGTQTRHTLTSSTHHDSHRLSQLTQSLKRGLGF